jgi:ABC-type phosphate/phosphonate transport system ATPase subunit
VLGLRGGRLVFDGPARDLTDTAVGEIFGAAAAGGEAAGEPAPLAEAALVAS